MKNSILKRRFVRLAGSAFAVLLVGGTLTGCSDDLLTGTPSWLGESIYDELEKRGDFNETLKLINAQDEDYASVLKRTGSKTLFVADDEAWKQFYENNSWGVKSIDEMSNAQRKLLFKGNMINSAYLVELLGNIPSSGDPIEGKCMRRASSVELMDSVPLVLAAQFPVINPVRLDSKTGEQIDYWSRLRGKKSAYILQDDEVQSMIHFMPKFMQNNSITSEDVEFLTNGGIKTNEEAFINGKVITEKDITCQNGYIHQLEGVAVPLDNMANVIAQNPQFSIYSRMLDRFSYPHYDATASANYKTTTGAEDSIFVKRYFNEHQSHSLTARDADKDEGRNGGAKVTNVLPYDPGWNRYIMYSASGMTYQYDAGVMLVPTDDALMQYLQNDGADLNQRYAKAGPGATAWDNAPDEVVLPLLTNTMLSSLKSSIPSQFSSINNSASEPMGVQKADIDQVLWACNGVIYQTNKVYVAPEYVSVYYPCVIRGNDDLYLTYTVVNNDKSVTGGEGFYAYLNNMGSKYSFIIPTNKALQNYYDPVSRYRTDSKGESTAVAYQFYINDAGYIAANVPLVDWTTLDANGRGTIGTTEYSTAPSTESTSGVDRSHGDAFNHFKDILNSSLSVGLFTPEQKFYQAKNGGPVIVEWNGNTLTGVAGSFQYERGYFIPVTESFDKSDEGNGRSYIIDEEPLMSTTTSPYAAINDSTRADEFGEFATLLDGMDIIGADDGYKHATIDMCLKNLNNYNYTIYVPTNSSIRALIDSHKMPTWEDVDNISGLLADNTIELSDEDEIYLTEQKQIMTDVISNFVNYHIHDNSIYIDGEEYNNNVFESECLDTTTNRFFKLYVTYNHGGQMKVTDNCGNVRTVDANTNNILTRQYYFSNAKGSTAAKLSDATQIYSSSFAVIHQINEPLYPNKSSLYNADDYAKVYAIIQSYQSGSGDSSATTVKHRRR